MKKITKDTTYFEYDSWGAITGETTYANIKERYPEIRGKNPQPVYQFDDGVMFQVVMSESKDNEPLATEDTDAMQVERNKLADGIKGMMQKYMSATTKTTKVHYLLTLLAVYYKLGGLDRELRSKYRYKNMVGTVPYIEKLV